MQLCHNYVNCFQFRNNYIPFTYILFLTFKAYIIGNEGISLLNFRKKSEKTMENTFLAKLNNFVTTVFDKIAVSRTRQALISLDDRTLADIGYTRQQVLNGDFFNITDVVDFPAGNLGLNKAVKQDNKIDDKEAA